MGLHKETTQLQLNQVLHILTISDLYLRHYRPVKTKPCLLSFKPNRHGWMWSLPDTELYPFEKLVKIINNRDDDGLAGTYHDGEVPDGHIVEKFFAHFVRPFLRKKKTPYEPTGDYTVPENYDTDGG